MDKNKLKDTVNKAKDATSSIRGILGSNHVGSKHTNIPADKKKGKKTRKTRQQNRKRKPKLSLRKKHKERG